MIVYYFVIHVMVCGAKSYFMIILNRLKDLLCYIMRHDNNNDIHVHVGTKINSYIPNQHWGSL